MRNIPTNCDDIIDSRDIIKRLEELESDREDLQTAIEEAKDALEEARSSYRENTEEALEMDLNEAVDSASDALEAAEKALEEWNDLEEYEALKALDAEASGYSSDWRHGETLIADGHFTQYAEELAEDIGAIDRNASWPLSHIDWDAAAEELKQDYTSVDFGGNEYWIRSC